MISSVYKYIIDYILPKRCFSCMELIQDDNGFCGTCWKDLNFITSPFCNRCGKEFELEFTGYSECLACINKLPEFTSSRSLLKFDEHSKNLVHAFKYYDKTILADCFASMLYARYKNDLQNADIIIPIPMHRIKRLLRMYNTAQLLGKSISAISDLPVYCDILYKTKWTKSQSSLSRKQRLTNINGSMLLKNAEKIKGKNIVLIDDVITTGATVNYSSKLLKKAGVKDIIVLSIASA